MLKSFMIKFSWEFENLDLFSKEAEARNIDPSIYNTVIKDFEETEYQAIAGNVGLNKVLAK